MRLCFSVPVVNQVVNVSPGVTEAWSAYQSRERPSLLTFLPDPRKQSPSKFRYHAHVTHGKRVSPSQTSLFRPALPRIWCVSPETGSADFTTKSKQQRAVRFAIRDVTFVKIYLLNNPICLVNDIFRGWSNVPKLWKSPRRTKRRLIGTIRSIGIVIICFSGTRRKFGDPVIQVWWCGWSVMTCLLATINRSIYRLLAISLVLKATSEMNYSS